MFQNYITSSDGKFFDGKSEFRFIGCNMYELANVDSVTSEKMLTSARQQGFDVIRFWAFGNVNSNKLSALCDIAERLDLRLIPVLSDSWGYLQKEKIDDSWYSEGFRNSYLPKISEKTSYLSDRKEILFWELMNEPAVSDIQNLIYFVKTVTAEIRKLNQNHLISIGTIGGVGDKFGNVISLGERDCSIQTRHQKLIEESPSPFIDNTVRQKMSEAAIKGAKSVNYIGAGTIEFLVDKDKNFYFMEMNTRIQVEHPVTEAITGIDLIREQIRIADRKKLSKKKIAMNGHSIECRINAEDPANNFRPSPGIITAFNQPGGIGVRVDTHCYNGYTIPPYYDSMIGKLIVHASTRTEAIKKMSRALDEFIVEGIHTTIPFHKMMMMNDNFINNDFDTGFIDNLNKS